MIARALSTSLNTGFTGRELIDSLSGDGGVILSNDGQALGHVLGRPTVTLVDPQFSSVEWTERFVRDTMTRFSIKAAVIFKEGTEFSDPYPSRFIAQLGSGLPPKWLTKIAESERVVLYAPIHE